MLTGFEANQVERFKRTTEEKLRGVRCPEHHRAPRIQFHGDSLRDINISLSGCCEKVMELANARIASPPIGSMALTKFLARSPQADGCEHLAQTGR